MSSMEIYRFGEFAVSPAQRSLTRHGSPVPLTSKAFDLLLYLMQNPGRVLGREELLHAVWGDVIVEDRNLNQAVFTIRKALSEADETPGNDAKYIQTIAGKGYQFVAQVEQRQQAPVEQIPLVRTLPGRTSAHPGPVLMETAVPDVLPEPAVAQAKPALVMAQPRKRAIAGVVAATVVVVLAAVLFVVWTVRGQQPAPITVYAAGFVNHTGDPVFDNMLNQAFRIDLLQSPFLTLLSNGDVRSALTAMKQPVEQPVTDDAVAREVCQRNNANVVLLGGISKAGNSYPLTMEAVDCASGKTVTGARETASSPEDTLRALGAITTKLRKQLGESSNSVARLDQPVLAANTTSLQALKAYSDAVHSAQFANDSDALVLFKRAVELDPNLAVAWAGLFVTEFNMGDKADAMQAINRAYALRDNASQRDRFYIEGLYNIRRDMDKATETYKQWAQIYPRDSLPWMNLAGIEQDLGHYPESLVAARKAAELSNGKRLMDDLARDYKRTGQYGLAKQVIAGQFQHGFQNSYLLHDILFQCAVAEHDSAAMAKEMAWAKGQPTEPQMVHQQALASAAVGQWKLAREQMQHAIDLAAAQPDSAFAANANLDLMWLAALMGDDATAHELLAKVDPATLEREDAFDAAYVAGLEGDNAFVQKTVAILDKTSGPYDTLERKIFISVLQAMLSLNDNKPALAVSQLTVAQPYDLRDYAVPTLRARALAAAGRYDDSAAQWRVVLNNPGIWPISPMYNLAHLGLARTLAAKGDKTGAAAEYDKFLAIYKDADPDLPVLLQAKAERAKLTAAGK
jgi:DNA-binding winged helix-turn-helix (wHTH) protein/tetratricopeptide (TPR) repeat protein